MADETLNAGIDLHIHQPHPARMYDYYLGGTTNFAADRAAAGRVLEAFPNARIAAHTNRAFVHRSTFEAAARGIDQFLDIGTGIPTKPNVHEVAQRVNRAAHVVYVDNDPIVLTLVDALMDGTPEGRTEYVQGDLLDPAAILRAASEVLDLSRPVALSLNAVLHFVADRPERTAAGIVATLRDGLAPGSLLTISHFTPDFAPDEALRLQNEYRRSGIEAKARTYDEVLALFDGWNLLLPGLVTTPRWRPDTDTGTPQHSATDAEASCYAGVAQLP
ncbi:SAM-dependent methyltransferase [Kitasatospora griseola]|uniref:SAM-dependent methyltransferase n=1 Tax=Kitasatospora griseola TaxID=2064 RepID=UPI0038082A9E